MRTRWLALGIVVALTACGGDEPEPSGTGTQRGPFAAAPVTATPAPAPSRISRRYHDLDSLDRGTVSGSPAPTGTTTTTTTTVAGTATLPTSDPQNALMTIASDRWTQAQACLNGQHVDATLTLGVDGRVMATLDAPLHGTAVEACVQQVVADVSVSMQGQASPVTVMLTL